MKINNMTKYILFAFISFCSIIGIAFADDTIQIGQSRSIQKHCDLSGDSSLISDGYITIEHPNGGTNIKFNKEYPFNNQRIELKCTDGSVVSYTLNNTIFSGNNDNNENNFNKNNIISAYVGNGTCSFNGWKTVTYEGKTHYEYEATSPITLPSDCKMSDKEFGGWLSIPTGATGYITEQSGSNACQGANKNVTTS